MLTGRDKETGLGLSDENIKQNVSFMKYVNAAHAESSCVASDFPHRW